MTLQLGEARPRRLLDEPPLELLGREPANGTSRRRTAEPMRPAPTVPTCIPSRS
jgi:hypothetical protein